MRSVWDKLANGSRLPSVTEQVLARFGTVPRGRAATGSRSVLYVKFGNWLVRPGYVWWFMRRRREGFLRQCRRVRHVILALPRGSSLANYPLITFRPAPPEKVTFFDVKGRRKRLAWRQAGAMERHIAGTRYFSKPPAAAPRVFASDARDRWIDEEFVGELFTEEEVEVEEVVPILLDLHAAHAPPAVGLARHLEANREHVDLVVDHLGPGEGDALEAAVARLWRAARREPDRAVYLGHAHNDLVACWNTVRVGSGICFLDFDQSFEASIWYDLIHMHYTHSITLDQLVGFLNGLNRRCGIPGRVGAETVGWYVDLFTVDYCRHLSTAYFREGLRPKRVLLRRLAEVLASPLRRAWPGEAACAASAPETLLKQDTYD